MFIIGLSRDFEPQSSQIKPLGPPQPVCGGLFCVVVSYSVRTIQDIQ